MHHEIRSLSLCVCVMGAAIVGCSEGAAPNNTPDSGRRDVASGDSDAGVSGGVTDGGADSSAVDSSFDGGGCVDLDLMATSVRRPLDIIVWVDDGGSFAAGRTRTGPALSQMFPTVLRDAGVDYRIILMSRTTPVTAPLLMDEGTRFFRTSRGYSAGAGGFVFFSDAMYIRDYLPWLRRESFKVFLSNTDCENQAGAFEAFETALMANGMGNFTVGDARNYVYNMIGALPLRMPTDEPYRPMDPAAGGNCRNTQIGAQRTGGMRLGYTAPNYIKLFQAIADLSISRSRLPCSFDPPTDRGMMIDLARVRFVFTPGGGAARTYRQVTDMGACGADGGFYVDASNKIVLCPSTCTTVSGDAMGAVRFSFQCVPG